MTQYTFYINGEHKTVEADIQEEAIKSRLPVVCNHLGKFKGARCLDAHDDHKGDNSD